MKYILICIAALLICFGVAYIAIRFFRRGRKGKLKNAALTVIVGIVLMIILTFIYLGIYSRAGEKAEAAMKGSDKVTVTETDGGWYFNGPSESTAIVFYQGAKVEAEAYAPLMLKLAEAGFDCFLADMPFNFAIFKGDAADLFIDKYDYDNWLMAGHSMGGIMASDYAEKNSDTVNGVILLASYTSVSLNDKLKLCSIYGSNDGCLDKKEYERCKANWPEESFEYVIEGGNHSQFGDYGEQKNDGKASIDADNQQDKTVEIIKGFFGKQVEKID